MLGISRNSHNKGFANVKGSTVNGRIKMELHSSLLRNVFHLFPLGYLGCPSPFPSIMMPCKWTITKLNFTIHPFNLVSTSYVICFVFHDARIIKGSRKLRDLQYLCTGRTKMELHSSLIINVFHLFPLGYLGCLSPFPSRS